nr:MAG TPA: hypothetical protein [Caudoviricetes sp.]
MLCRHAWRVSGRDLARGHCAADHCDGCGSDLRACFANANLTELWTAEPCGFAGFHCFALRFPALTVHQFERHGNGALRLRNQSSTDQLDRPTQALGSEADYGIFGGLQAD